jgi:hypothetical protein
MWKTKKQLLRFTLDSNNQSVTMLPVAWVFQIILECKHCFSFIQTCSNVCNKVTLVATRRCNIFGPSCCDLRSASDKALYMSNSAQARMYKALRGSQQERPMLQRLQCPPFLKMLGHNNVSLSRPSKVPLGIL